MGWMDQLRNFYKDVLVEAGKVSWPTRQELRDSTIVVIVTVAVITVFVGVVDRILTAGIATLFR